MLWRRFQEVFIVLTSETLWKAPRPGTIPTVTMESEGEVVRATDIIFRVWWMGSERGEAFWSKKSKKDEDIPKNELSMGGGTASGGGWSEGHGLNQSMEYTN